MLVHPSSLSRRDQITCVTQLRTQLGRAIFPVHRLDRGASGVLAFALNSEAAHAWSEIYRRGRVKKSYWVVVRGFAPESGTIDKPIRRANGTEVSALTHWERLQTIEHSVAVGRYPTLRYSLLRVEIETGRFHQIRKHLASLSYPVLGDTWYGDGKHNRALRKHFGIHRILLFSNQMEFGDARAEISFPEELEKLGFNLN